MEKLKKLLNLEESSPNSKLITSYIIIAYLFSISIRFFLYYQAADNSDYFYNGNIIPLWTADAGLYGYYANQLFKWGFISFYSRVYAWISALLDSKYNRYGA